MSELYCRVRATRLIKYLSSAIHQSRAKTSPAKTDSLLDSVLDSRLTARPYRSLGLREGRDLTGARVKPFRESNHTGTTLVSIPGVRPPPNHRLMSFEVVLKNECIGEDGGLTADPRIMRRKDNRMMVRREPALRAGAGAGAEGRRKVLASDAREQLGEITPSGRELSRVRLGGRGQRRPAVAGGPPAAGCGAAAEAAGKGSGRRAERPGRRRRRG